MQSTPQASQNSGAPPSVHTLSTSSSVSDFLQASPMPAGMYSVRWLTNTAFDAVTLHALPTSSSDTDAYSQ